jgi:4-hydroxy-tetrahydrodipicolinate synthase
VALVTPFSKGQIDKTAMHRLVADLAARGVSGFVPLGTTGEASTLSDDERREIIQLVIDAAGKVPVVPGCGTNNTAQSIDNVREAEALGVRGVMVITPYYNKPTQKGLVEHFTAIADNTKLPLLLYNVPGRTSVNMLPETVAVLAAHPRIAAIKEASGDLEQISQICACVEGRMSVLSGDDALTLPIMAVGGTGVVSVVGQVVPEPLVEMVDCAAKFELDKAIALHRMIAPISKIMFCETNPAPVKCALSLQGKIKNEFRLPMLPVGDENRRKISKTLKAFEAAMAVADE